MLNEVQKPGNSIEITLLFRLTFDQEFVRFQRSSVRKSNLHPQPSPGTRELIKDRGMQVSLYDGFRDKFSGIEFEQNTIRSVWHHDCFKAGPGVVSNMAEKQEQEIFFKK
jgi:hypothetical protein